MKLEKYTMGVGDRFGHQGKAQLAAMAAAHAAGIPVIPVWNKSFREHSIIGTRPPDARAAATAAVKAAGWKNPWHLDADHISLKNVAGFIDCCDFFTLDVAETIGKSASDEEIAEFAGKCAKLGGELRVPGVATPIRTDPATVHRVAARYLLAVREAGELYRHLVARKGADTFVTEVSMDETAAPQTPDELLFILYALSLEKVPAATIAPKFSGRFNKGVDYVGNPAQFAREFAEDLAVIRYAVERFGLPAELKLSVHSGSDKFSIYEPIRKALAASKAGLHLKTAGTTWLEEIAGLAEAGGDGLAIAREIYVDALERFDEMCGPYATVIDIDRAGLPEPEQVDEWDGPRFAAAIRHDPTDKRFNPNLRQLLHVGYKVAAEMGDRFYAALDAAEPTIARHVTANLWEKHIRRIFPPMV